MSELTLTYARRRTLFGAESFGLRSRFVDEIPPALTDASDDVFGSGTGRIGAWGVGGGGGAPGIWAAASAAGGASASRRTPAPEYRVGEDVVHASFGEGVVTGLERDGIVIVRFAADGSERRLLAEFAPELHFEALVLFVLD